MPAQRGRDHVRARYKYVGLMLYPRHKNCSFVLRVACNLENEEVVSRVDKVKFSSYKWTIYRFVRQCISSHVLGYI